MSCYFGEGVFSLGLGCFGGILGTDTHAILVEQCYKVSCTGGDTRNDTRNVFSFEVEKYL